MNRDYVLFNLREAAEELGRTINAVESGEDGEVDLMIAMQHVYHHLNTAWNARGLTLSEPTSAAKQTSVLGGNFRLIST